jgi:hypothetical protein
MENIERLIQKVLYHLVTQRSLPTLHEDDELFDDETFEIEVTDRVKIDPTTISGLKSFTQLLGIASFVATLIKGKSLKSSISRVLFIIYT